MTQFHINGCRCEGQPECRCCILLNHATLCTYNTESDNNLNDNCTLIFFLLKLPTVQPENQHFKKRDMVLT